MSIRVATYRRTNIEQKNGATGEQEFELQRRLEFDPERRIVATFVDEGVSGLVPASQRSGAAEMLAAAQRGAFDELWVSHIDGLSRDETELFALTRLLARLGVRLRAVSGDVESVFVLTSIQAARGGRRVESEPSPAGRTRRVVHYARVSSERQRGPDAAGIPTSHYLDPNGRRGAVE